MGGGGLIRGNYGFLRNKVNSVYWVTEENNHQLVLVVIQLNQGQDAFTIERKFA
jgi:hypothetical protein